MELNLFEAHLINVRFTRIGRLVTFEIPEWNYQYSTQSFQPLSFGSFPFPDVPSDMAVRFRPNADIVCYSRIKWQNVGEDPYEYLDGYVTITTNGTLTWTTYNKSDNTMTLNVGATTLSVSWSVDVI